MPNYIYKHKLPNETCPEEFELKQNYNDNALVQCPECHEPVKRIIKSHPPVKFRGDGFASNDLNTTKSKYHKI